MSRLKYDGYESFSAGARFIENLVNWLQQFDRPNRENAYSLARRHLVYIGAAEMKHLVKLIYPQTVQPRLIQAVADRVGIPTYKVWSNKQAAKELGLLRRKTLFLGLSDGAHMDDFRRANAGVVSNEQVVVATQINPTKWDDLLKNLQKAVCDDTARFSFVFLIDDFVGSGTTLMRWDAIEKCFKGRLPRFWDEVQNYVDSHFEEDWTLCVHHYIATHQASKSLDSKNEEVKQTLKDQEKLWFNQVEFTFGMILPEELPLQRQPELQNTIVPLVEKFYDPTIQNKHTDLGGEDIRYGFGSCGLPLILEHNTPNNSLAILWAESREENDYHNMRPLFVRRQRHE